MTKLNDELIRELGRLRNDKNNEIQRVKRYFGKRESSDQRRLNQ